MRSIADQLPPEIAAQIHPDRRKNEAAYWAVRDQLLDQYRGQWIGFADGVVVASGNSPVTVFHAAEATGRHPFFICVGWEEEPCRIRRVSSAYDARREAGRGRVWLWSAARIAAFVSGMRSALDWRDASSEVAPHTETTAAILAALHNQTDPGMPLCACPT